MSGFAPFNKKREEKKIKQDDDVVVVVAPPPPPRRRSRRRRPRYDDDGDVGVVDIGILFVRVVVYVDRSRLFSPVPMRRRARSSSE